MTTLDENIVVYYVFDDDEPIDQSIYNALNSRSES